MAKNHAVVEAMASWDTLTNGELLKAPLANVVVGNSDRPAVERHIDQVVGSEQSNAGQLYRG